MIRSSVLLALTPGLFTIAAPVSAQETVPLIPREALFGNPTRLNGRFSPDGQWLSWLAPHNGVTNIWVAPANDVNAARPITNERLRPIRSNEGVHSWSPDSGQILFLQDKGGDENFALYGVDVLTGAQRVLTAFDNARVRVVKASRNVKDRILISVNNRDRRWPDVHSLDLRSGKLTPVLINEGGYGSFHADEQLNLRIVSKPRPDAGTDYFRIVGNRAEAEAFEQVASEDAETTRPVGFTTDGRTLYWLDSRGRDTAALVAQDMTSGRKSVVAANAVVDIGSILTDPRSGRVDAYGIDYLTNEWVALDGRIQSDFAFLESRLKGEIGIASRTDADDKWIVSVDPVTAPSAAYLFDRKKRALIKLYVSREALEGAPLAAMHPVEIKARDGLTLVSYLTLPPGSDADGDRRPEKPVPLILTVHGGPWSRDHYGYSGNHQWLANRGYAVLSTNFRGSTGFGKTFISAGNLQWGRKMHDDLLDAVDWAVRSGITTKDKVGITGVSYGGYSTISGLAFTPEVFACGVSMSGQNDLNTLLETIPAEWQAQRMWFYKALGDPLTPTGQALLRESSPLFKAHQIKHPLLIGQGANDPRVPRVQSEQIVNAVKANGVPVTYLLFPDEGHNLVRPANRIAFNAIAENFFAKCLGGRAEPIGNAVRASSVKVPHGAEYTPGLEEALASK